MNTSADDAVGIKVSTTKDGHATIEQSSNSTVLSADEILAVIGELNVCYDYCAAWKESTDDTSADAEAST